MEVTHLTENDVPGAKLHKNPSECTVPVLKRWLECRALKKSGRRAELVERVGNALAMSVPIVSGIDNGKWYDAKQKGLANQPNSNNIVQSVRNDVISALQWTQFPNFLHKHSKYVQLWSCVQLHS